MFQLSKASLRCMQNTSLRPLLRVANHSTARPTVIVQNMSENTPATEEIKHSLPKHSIEKVKEIKTSGLVAAAFASLQEEDVAPSPTKLKPSFADKKILKATNVNELLVVNEDGIISRQHALKIVSILAQWSAAGKVDLADFESDPRFIKLCRILSRGNNNNSKFPARNPFRGDDLSMVLGVTGDDEAAKLIGSITLPQMIKVMSSLAQKKRRSTPLLRSLAYNISRSGTKLDLKQCADLLYSMTILNFPESVLLERISNDVAEGLETNNDRSAVIGSLLTSLGLLRYKDPGILDTLSEWVVKHYSICRPQDITALFHTIAVVNYHPSNAENLYNLLIPQLNVSDVTKPSAWLNTIWSLVLLNKASNEQISSVLNPEFIATLQDNTNAISSSSKAKLLNINAAAQYLIKNYNGPNLNDNSTVRSLIITRTKEKQTMVTSMLDSLGSLFSSSTYLKNNINTGMGFLIDGECIIDKKCNVVPVTKVTAKDHIRIAILAYDYHDTCRGDGSPHGANILAAKLLESQGYKLMVVPYTDFNPRDKLVQRVQYLEKQLKSIANSV